jgi:hypothetical protein
MGRHHEHRIFGESCREARTAHRVRVIIFRVVATLAGLFFVVAVVHKNVLVVATTGSPPVERLGPLPGHAELMSAQ